MDVIDLFDTAERREKTAAGIEKYRKGEMKICVKGKNGEPIRGAKLKITQKSHEFKFGVNLFLLDEMESAEKNEIYKKNVSDVFNMGVVPIYWDALEPVRGKPRFLKDSERVYRRPPVDTCIEFCKKNHIEPKAHCLNFDFFTPEWVQKLSVKEHKIALEERMRALAERYAAEIPCWEVINETLIDNGKTPLYYDKDVVGWSFDTARKYFPHNELIINENAKNVYPGYAHNRSQYYMQIERELARGRRIDGIGFQAHFMFGEEFRQKYANPAFLDKFFDTYSEFGLPLQLTEVTIPAVFGVYDGKTFEERTAVDEERQAAMLGRIYEYYFSLERAEAIIYWNLTDGYAWHAEPGDMTAGENVWRGGLVDFDGRRKPAYEVLNTLVNKTWRTQANVNSDKNGEARSRGFFGEYEIEAEIPAAGGSNGGAGGIKRKKFAVNFSKEEKEKEIILQF